MKSHLHAILQDLPELYKLAINLDQGTTWHQIGIRNITPEKKRAFFL
jgi:hypothetical protein